MSGSIATNDLLVRAHLRPVWDVSRSSEITIRSREPRRQSTVNKARGQEMETTMGRDILLWLLGVPLGVIILLHLIGAFH